MTPSTGRPGPDREIRSGSASGGGFWRRYVATRFHRTQPQSLAETTSDSCNVPAPVRQRVLRDYHVMNVAAARRAAEELVREGFNTGAVPYGYRAQRVRVAPAGRRQRWRTRLMIEPVEAAVVKMIFTWRVEEELTVAEILDRLTSARYPAPLNRDTGEPAAWTPGVIKSVLRNPKYLGRQIWGRSHHGRRTPGSSWVWSPPWTHPPLVSAELFTAANRWSELPAAPPTATSRVQRGHRTADR